MLYDQPHSQPHPLINHVFRARLVASSIRSPSGSFGDGTLMGNHPEIAIIAIEIVSFPMKNGGSFHSFCNSLPEGNHHLYFY